jgi:PAS domain S-box-containing protein
MSVEPQAAGELPFEDSAPNETLRAYARLLDALPAPAWLAGVDGYVLLVSPAWVTATGISAAEICALGIEHCIHEDDRPFALAAWDAALRTTTPYTGEFRLRYGDGSFRWVVSQANPIRSGDGTAIGWLGTVTDIHDRRVAEDRLAHRDELLQKAQARDRLMTESIPGSIWTATPDGMLDHVADGRSKTLRRPATARLADEWLNGVHPDDRERVRLRWQTAIETGDPYEMTMRALMADGTYRWHLARGLQQRSDDDEILGWIGVSMDIDDHVRTDAEREKFVRLADRSGDIIGIADPAGIVIYANPAALEFFETSRDEIIGEHFLKCFTPEDADFVAAEVVPIVERGGRWAGEFRFRNFRTGRALPIWYDVFAITDPTGDVTGFATISRDLRERQRFDIGMRALADAGKAMHGSLDFDTTMQNIADAVVAGFASACSVEVQNGDGTIRTKTLANRDPATIPAAWAAADQRNAGIWPGHPILRAIEHGESTLKKILEKPFLESTGIDKHIGPKPDQLDLCSVIFVPVRSPRDGRVYASLSCGMGAGDPRGTYTEEDVRFAEEIAARAGVAFDNAHAYERTRRVAAEMQAASLPTSLPQSPGLQLHAEYRPADDEATIGGDWYDAFLLPDGRVAMTIGDVAGHGLQAAIWMTKMRQAMQAAAMLDPDPRVMLGVANRTLLMLEKDVYASAMAAIYDGKTRSLVVASAGHPGPAIARHGGVVDEMLFPGFLLGVVDENGYDLHTIQLEPGDLAVFYTDGLVETDRDFTRGGERLRTALERSALREAANPALAIFEGVLDGASIQDDVAILTARATR